MRLPQIRALDAVWLIFLAALAGLGLTKQEHSLFEWLVLLVLGAVQIAETRLDVASDRRTAMLSIAVKAVLCYWLVAETGGIESSYYLIFLLPIVSAASLFEAGGALLATLLCSGLYLSFLLFVDFERYYLMPEGVDELSVRVIFFFVSAILVNRLATENRRKTESLAEAYRDLKEAQAEVRRSERLAALGQLSAGLAHEIRNPLGVISASAELLGKHVSKENDVAREVAGFIRSEVHRSNLLVSRFLDFARPSQLQRGTHDLNEVIGRALSQLADNPTNGPGRIESGPIESGPIEIEKHLGALPEFSFDSTLIESAIVNLLANAQEAMPSGGRLTVRTRRLDSNAEIVVSDTGCGIATEQMENIFNPFFTTKPTGVGLGLAMVSKFIDSHGGKITVTSEAGKGSNFRITLPMGERP